MRGWLGLVAVGMLWATTSRADAPPGVGANVGGVSAAATVKSYQGRGGVIVVSPPFDPVMYPYGPKYAYPLYAAPTADYGAFGYSAQFVWPRYGVYRGLPPRQP